MFGKASLNVQLKIQTFGNILFVTFVKKISEKGLCVVPIDTRSFSLSPFDA